MKPFNLSSYFWITGLLFITSCKELIEPSLTKRQVNLEAPADNFSTPNYNVNFWWDTVDDALSYRLQIVTGTFSSPETLVTDTLVNANKFLMTLDPGQYQWRVLAENGGSQSPYSQVRSFEVQYSSIKSQTTRLSLPASGTLSNQGHINLQWQGMYGATRYHVQVDTNGFIDEDQIVFDRNTPATQLIYNLSNDGKYQWRVRAENDTAQAKWSAVSRFEIDRTAPPAPVAIAPALNSTVDNPVDLQWSSPAGAVQYKLFILRSDSTTNYSSGYPVLLKTPGFKFNSSISGERVYWRVRAIDAAGNEGAPGKMMNFVIR